MMKEKLSKVKTFVNDHKKELIVGAGVTGTVLIGSIVYMITKQKPKIADISSVVTKIEDLEKPELDFGRLDELWREDSVVNLIVNDITVADLGAFGEQLKKINGVADDTTVTALMGLLNIEE